MCGRYAASRGAEELVEELGIAVDATGGRLRPTYNAAPTTQRAIVRAAAPGPAATAEATGTSGTTGPPRRELALAGWGLVPFFSRDGTGGARMINARSETVMDKPAYRRAIRRSRVLVPVDGWYEWQRGTEDGKATKVAHFMSATDGATLLLAGIAETWRPRTSDGPGDGGTGAGPAGKEGVDDAVTTFSILTRDAHGILAQVHDRTPVIVPSDLLDDWIDTGLDGRDDVTALLAATLGAVPEGAPASAGGTGGLQAVPVGRAVGNVRSEGPGLVAPTGPPLA